MEAIKHRLHKSAQSPEARLYLQNETFNKVKEGFTKTTIWGQIKHNTPLNLNISPVATVPHKSRNSRVILDLSFQLKINKITIPSINTGTTKGNGKLG